jgi:hypothetical protein
MRFYFCHIVIGAVPLVMVLTRVHVLDYRRIFKAPFMFYCVLGIILINEVVLVGAGFAEKDIELLFAPDYRNSSFIFGPLEEFEKVAVILTVFTPKLFLTVPVGPDAGSPYYWPILWIVIPAYIYICLFSLIFALPFEHAHMKADILRLKENIIKTKIFTAFKNKLNKRENKETNESEEEAEK